MSASASVSGGVEGNPTTPAGLLTSLRWRYATKQFDPTRKIPDEVWIALEEALVLTPSSYGLQPWTFIIVSDPELRSRLRGLSWGQAQVTDSSHYVVFAARKSLDEVDVGRFLDRAAEVRGVARETLDGLGKRIASDLIKGPRAADVSGWAARQVFIALGNFLTSASLLGVDACPLEGINPAGYDDALGLPPLGFRTVVAAAAGYRLAEDRYAALPKVRFHSRDVILRR